MRYVLFAERDCLISSTARNAVQPFEGGVEIIYPGECDLAVAMYGIKQYPTLLVLDKYGVIVKRIEGFSKRKYDEIFGGR